MRILASAEPYGFGPVSKLRAIAKELRGRGHRIDFVGTGTALTYAQMESSIFANVVSAEPAELNEVITEQWEYDIVLSAMDPYLAVWAHRRGIPCIYVDSLFWMWDWQSLTAMNSVLNEVRAARSWNQVLAILAKASMPTAEYIGHSLATISCVQRTVSTPARAQSRPSLRNVKLIGGIVDREWMGPREKDGLLVSLSGLVNPLTTIAMAEQWASAALRLVSEAIARASLSVNVHLTGNHDVLSRLEFPSHFSYKKRNADQTLSLIAQSQACLTPPGLTTMFEAVAYGCAIVPLPAQHYAHDNILDEFARLDPGAFPRSFDSREFAVEVDNSDAARSTANVIDSFSRMALHGSTPWNSVVDRLASSISAALTDAKLLERQATAVRSYMEDFDGSLRVAETVEQALN